MQRNRSETLLNVMVLSVALVVSYVAPRLATPAEERHVAAPAHSINLRSLERSIVVGDDDDDEDAAPGAGKVEIEIDESDFEGEGGEGFGGLRGRGRRHARGLRLHVR
jgi:hypothetical protein